MIRRPAAVVLVVTLFAVVGFAQERSADLVLHSGKIVTVDPSFSIVEAMAIRDDRILAVGTTAEIRKLSGPGTRVVDLKGKMVLPGLVDSHMHPTSASMYEFDYEVPKMETIGDVLRYIRSRADLLPDGQWISLSQVFITRLREQRYPTRAELDCLHPEQIISRQQAIQLYTINNAFLTFEEKEKGSLEPGKLADFIVLDRDILSCPVDEIRSANVEQTWLGGRLIYSR